MLQWFDTIKLQRIECTVREVQESRSVTLLKEKKKEIYVNYTLWDCEFCNTDTCEFSLGLEILAFPCNQFAGQEPGTNDEIQEVACTRLKAEFPIFDKVIYDKYIVTYKSLFFPCRIWSSLLCSLFIICLLFYLDLTCCK